MIFVTPWYCKRLTYEQDGNRLYIRMEFTTPIRWFFRAAEGVKWTWRRVKRALR